MTNRIKELVKEVLGEDYSLIKLHSSNFATQYAIVEKVCGLLVTFTVTNNDNNVFQAQVNTASPFELKKITTLFNTIEGIGR